MKKRIPAKYYFFTHLFFSSAITNLLVAIDIKIIP